jgi:hypothetical protein
MKLIGIAGAAGAGKDTLRCELRPELYKLSTCLVFQENFADPLKKAAAELFGIDVDDFYNLDHKKELNPFWGVSPRQIAQFFGTEMVRETMGKLLFGIGENFWIKRLEKDFDLSLDHILMIADVRFQNEVDWIISNGGIVIKLYRPGADGNVGIPNHPSEAGFQIYPHQQGAYHEINNNGTVEQMTKSAISFIKTHFGM